MGQIAAGQLVKVATPGPQIDGIVFDVPSASKVLVAVIDRAKGPVLRSVAADAVSEREQEGPDDAALQLLIRRTPATSRGGGSGGTGVQGSSGHSRATGHRTTGK